MTTQTPAEALARLRALAVVFAVQGREDDADELRDIHATLARAVEDGSELLAADLQYDDARRKWHRWDGTLDELDECEKRMAEAEERRENAIDTALGVGRGSDA